MVILVCKYNLHTQKIKIRAEVDQCICEPSRFHSKADEVCVLLGYGTM
jgi:hypothetical protein